jgi:hypothetical protein
VKSERNHKGKYLKYILGVFIIILLGITAVVLFIMFPYLRQSNKKSYQSLKLRFPHGDFEQCCSTEDQKKMFLSACNDLFQKEELRCLNVLKGSIIIELFGFVEEDINKSSSRVLSKSGHIHGESITDFHVYTFENAFENLVKICNEFINKGFRSSLVEFQNIAELLRETDDGEILNLEEVKNKLSFSDLISFAEFLKEKLKKKEDSERLKLEEKKRLEMEEKKKIRNGREKSIRTIRNGKTIC